MSFSTLQCCKTAQYDSNSFPRVSEFKQKLATFMNPIDADDDPLRWITAPEDPTLMFYVSTNSVQVDTNDFAVKVPTREVLTVTDIPEGFNPPEPFAVVCILQNNRDGSLTTQDKKVLNMIRALPNKYKDHCVFVTDSQSLTNKTLQSLSKSIGLELKKDSGFNEIFHRLFVCHSREIPIRLSLYLEKQLLERIRREQKKLKDICRIEETLREDNFWMYQQTMDDIFNGEPCQRFLRTASMKYICPDEHTRNTFKVYQVKWKVARFICKEFGEEIAKKLIKTFKSDLRAKTLEFTDCLLQHVDVTNITRILVFAILTVIEGIIFGATFMVIFSAIYVLAFSESLNSETFRHKIADTVFAQISKNKDQIILKILNEFYRVQSNRICVARKDLRRVDDVLSKVENAKLEALNMTDCCYHELKIVAKRFVTEKL